jgi:hypothetical protein
MWRSLATLVRCPVELTLIQKEDPHDNYSAASKDGKQYNHENIHAPQLLVSRQVAGTKFY